MSICRFYFHAEHLKVCNVTDTLTNKHAANVDFQSLEIISGFRSRRSNIILLISVPSKTPTYLRIYLSVYI